MDFRLSPHGEWEMMRCSIPLALVQAVMEHSEQRIADESRLVRYIHQSRLPFKMGRCICSESWWTRMNTRPQL